MACSDMSGGAKKRSREEIAEQVFSHQRISIECGERTFTSTRRTWTLVDSSVIAVAVSLVEPSNAAVTLDHFFDESPDAFALVVSHLRSNCRTFSPPESDRELEEYWGLARKLGFVRLASHLELEVLRRRWEREAAYLDGQISRTRHCMDAWRRRCRTVDVKPLILNADASDGANPSAAALLEKIETAKVAKDSVGFSREYMVAGSFPLCGTDDEGLTSHPSTKVCVLLQSERALHDDDRVPDRVAKG